MSDHLVEVVADFWGCHWAECSCGWRSVRSIDRQDVEVQVEAHHRDPFARLMEAAARATAAALAERGDQ